MRQIKKFILTSVIVLVLAGLVVLGIEAIFQRQTQGLIYKDLSNLPPTETAIILGASVHSNGKLSPILKDRVDTAIMLYSENKIENFLVSGDHRSEDYNEVTAMANYLMENGIEEDKILLDPAGLDTYDSMYRAGKLFEIKSAVVITQEFHLPRALFIAKNLGLDYRGFAARQNIYETENKLINREKLANIKALWEVSLKKEPASMEKKPRVKKTDNPLK